MLPENHNSTKVYCPKCRKNHDTCSRESSIAQKNNKKALQRTLEAQATGAMKGKNKRRARYMLADMTQNKR